MYFLLVILCVTLTSSTEPGPQWINDGWSESSGIAYSDWKEYCKVDDDWKVRNRCTWEITGNFSSFLGVYISLPSGTSDRDMNFVADIPYWQVATYMQGACKTNFVVMWFVACDATLCPLLAPGLYLSVTETSNKLIFPRRATKEYRQEYQQVYETPSSPGNPPQDELWDAIRVNIDKWAIGLYTVKATGKVAYEELSSVDIPHKHLYHSAQSYAPSYRTPGLSAMAPWVYIDAYDNGLLDEPARTAYTLYRTGNLPLVEYAPGKKSNLLPLFPPSGKRQSGNQVTLSSSDYDKYLAKANLAKANKVMTPTH